MRNHKWKISKVSTPGRVFHKSTEKMAQSVGVMLSSADCNFKNEIKEIAYCNSRRG